MNRSRDCAVVQGGWAQAGHGWGPTCPILHVLHLHDFSVDSTPEDIQGAVDGFGPLGGFLAPSDPERQWEVNVPYASSPWGSTVFNRAKGSKAVTQKGARGHEKCGNQVRSMAFWLVVG